jgi:hypothetical protein
VLLRACYDTQIANASNRLNDIWRHIAANPACYDTLRYDAVNSLLRHTDLIWNFYTKLFLLHLFHTEAKRDVT